uniref:Uncharacterized protein n=1 Tax=Vannella robusta TaxID=1487602 RepID=A0A6U1UX46_9EUKA
MQQTTHLPPEYRKAAIVVDNFLASQYILRPRKMIHQSILEEGNIQMIERRFNSRDIPDGSTWRWNQTKGRKKVFLPTGVTADFYKMIPRNKTGNPTEKVPSYKLWCFQLTFPKGTKTHLLYCEKGVSPIPSINELFFLHEFMDPQVALQLWPGY